MYDEFCSKQIYSILCAIVLLQQLMIDIYALNLTYFEHYQFFSMAHKKLSATQVSLYLFLRYYKLGSP